MALPNREFFFEERSAPAPLKMSDTQRFLMDMNGAPHPPL